jgi:carboxylesterase type B
MKNASRSRHRAFAGHTLFGLAASVLVLAAAGKARASTNGPLPLIIRIHGGAFKSGDKSGEASSLPSLQARGYTINN